MVNLIPCCYTPSWGNDCRDGGSWLLFQDWARAFMRVTLGAATGEPTDILEITEECRGIPSN